MNAPEPLHALLAATDLSDCARRAAGRAALLAQAHGARLALLHSMQAPALQELREWLGADSPTEQRLREQAGGELDALAAALAQRHGVQAAQEITAGPVSQDICEAATRHGAELIVVGRVGLRFWHRLTLGSTAERVLRRCPQPVLAVREAPHEPYRRVLVPVDFSPASEAAVGWVRRVAPQAHLVLLHAWETPFEGRLEHAGVDEFRLADWRSRVRGASQARLEQLARAHGLAPGQWSFALEAGDAAFAIVRQQRAQDADLIAIGRQGRHPLDEFFLGSVTRHVLAEAETDVLVVPQPAG